ncbi:hypothetical protein EI94DRAFT_1189584 [Lactarius quietus]|nr:hypothetical protein EI94DRAFT_1189584 [Lactarius quietus]
MSLSVSSFPGALTTNPTWGGRPSTTTKRWRIGGRLNTGGASFMKGIRHIGKIQFKSSVTRFTHKSSSQNSPSPTTLTVKTSTIVIDILAVPHNEGHQSPTDTSHSAPVLDPTRVSRPKWRAVPLLARIPRPRAISTGARGAASRAVRRPRTSVNSEAAKSVRGGTTLPSPFGRRMIRETGPVPDLPALTLTLAAGDEADSSLSGVTFEEMDELSSEAPHFNPPPHETRSAIRRSTSTPSFLNAGSRNRVQSPLPPSPLPLLSVHIAQLRTGSRPTKPLPPLLGTGRRPKTAPTTGSSSRALPLGPRTPKGPRSRRDGQGSSSSNSGSPSHLHRSRSHPQLRTVAILASAERIAETSPADGSRSRAGSRPLPALALAETIYRDLPPLPGPAGPEASAAASATAETTEVLQEAPQVHGSPREVDKARDSEHSPRIEHEPGYVAWPMAPIVVMDPSMAWKMREKGAAVARQPASRRRLPYVPR